MVKIEQPKERLDARKKLRGEARFINDLSFPGMLHSAILRSPYGHARIKSIDTSRAQKVAGVEAIITGSDVKDYRVNLGIGDQLPLALDKVRFMGEPVAAVIAVDRWTAREAADLIAVEYEVLDTVMDARQGAEPGSPLIHEEQERYPRNEGIRFMPESNIFSHYKLRKGDIDKAFAAADLVIEGKYKMPHRAHAQLETHGAIARWTGDGEVEIYSSTQSPFLVRNCLADTFGVKSTDVRVKVGYLGGGFGGKSDVTIEPLVAAISRFVPGRHVKLNLSREEAFVGSVIGRGLEMEVSTALSKEGKIMGEKVKLYVNSGAYGSYSLHIVTAAGHNCNGAYEIDNIQVDAYGVYTNNPPVGAFRGYGHPDVHWGIERHRQAIADKLGMDPVEFRLLNILQPGSFNALGQEIAEENGDLRGCILKVAEELEKIEPETSGNKIIGKGLAAIMKSPVMATNAASSATLRFNEDGTVDVATSGVEMGQGTKTAMRQIAAAALQFPLEKVKMKEDIDTENSPYGWQTVASSTTWKSGQAIIDAANKAIEQIKENASLVLGIHPERLEYNGERVSDREEPANSVAVDDLTFGYMEANGRMLGRPVQAYGTYLPDGLVHPDPETGQGNAAGEWTFGAQGAVVEIDRDTGEVTVLNLLTAIDAGKIINPVLARNQIVGGMVQEMGGALTEEIVYGRDGWMRNNNFTDYKIPTPEDLADTKIDVYFFETPEPVGPFGARGIAEHGSVGITPAIGNAVSEALGVEINELPLTNEKVYSYLEEAGDRDV
ncbi:MAG: xanthine dehydrogenase family protein molybdopterin-binding subunit [Halanaerobium sp.]|nr:xanthine dehydrogenase family protein molybdopterin-binding subunit [Halanaerobium sp.]